MEERTPMKALRNITPPPEKEDLDISLNSSLVIVSGLDEIDDDLESLQKDLRRAERGIYLSHELVEEDSVNFGSPIVMKKEKERSPIRREIIDDSIKDQLTHLERENLDLNREVLTLTKEKKKLLKDIYEKNVTIRDMGKDKVKIEESGLEYRKVNNDLHNAREENLRLSQQLRERESMVTTLQQQLKDRQEGKEKDSTVSERIRQYLNGVEEEKARLTSSEEFLQTQIRNLKLEIGKLRETQRKSLEVTEAQQKQFEEQKNIDSRRIRSMKERYESKFEDVKREYETSFQKIRREYREDVNRKDEEILRLQNVVRRYERKRSIGSRLLMSSTSLDTTLDEDDDEDNNNKKKDEEEEEEEDLIDDGKEELEQILSSSGEEEEEEEEVVGMERDIEIDDGQEGGGELSDDIEIDGGD